MSEARVPIQEYDWASDVESILRAVNYDLMDDDSETYQVDLN